MKYSDRLYDLAYELKELAPWEIAGDNQLIAFQSPTIKETIYCNFMGLNGGHMALGAYIGDAGIQSLYSMITTDPGANFNEDTVSSSEVMFAMYSQDAVQCAFESDEDKWDKDDEQYRSFLKYARKHHKRVTGYHDIVSFEDFRPTYHPCTITDPQRLSVLEEALEVTLQYLHTHAEQLPFLPELNPLLRPIIPCYRRVDGVWVEGTCQIPAFDVTYQAEPMVYGNQIATHRLKKLPKSDAVLECELTLMPMPTMQDGFICMPICLIGVIQEDGFALTPAVQIKRPDEELQDVYPRLLEDFASNDLEHGLQALPKTIYYRGKYTYAALYDFCKKLGIHLIEEEELPELDEALDNLYQRVGPGADEENMPSAEELLEAMLSSFESMSDSELSEVPPMYRMMIEEFPMQDCPPEYRDRIIACQKRFKGLR